MVVCYIFFILNFVSFRIDNTFFIYLWVSSWVWLVNALCNLGLSVHGWPETKVSKMPFKPSQSNNCLWWHPTITIIWYIKQIILYKNTHLFWCIILESEEEKMAITTNQFNINFQDRSVSGVKTQSEDAAYHGEWIMEGLFFGFFNKVEVGWVVSVKIPNTLKDKLRQLLYSPSIRWWYSNFLKRERKFNSAPWRLSWHSSHFYWIKH